MHDPNVDISIRIEVLNAQRHFLGGTVDIVLTPAVAGTGQTINLKAADASKDIDVGGLAWR